MQAERSNTGGGITAVSEAVQATDEVKAQWQLAIDCLAKPEACK
jgi:hypothetical protein